jgi:hypothetical protein
MQRNTVIGSCLGLFLASLVSAEEHASRPKNGQAEIGKSVPARATASRSVPVAVRTAAAERTGNRPSVFSCPSGLSMPADRLIARLGYFPVNCVPMTPDTTYDLGFACYIRGMYDDAIAFANHGLTLRDDARLHLLKAVCQMSVGRCVEAEETVDKYLNAVASTNTVGLAVARERINGPMRVRVEQIVKYVTSL